MNVKKLREQRGLSQLAVSERLALSRTTYTKYENGVHDPSLSTLTEIAKLFGVPVDYIAGGRFCSCPDLAGRLRDCREAAGLTAKDAAALLDIPEELYGDFERARAEPTLDMLRRLACAFRTTADSLLGADGAGEERLLGLFRQSGPATRQAVWALLERDAAGDGLDAPAQPDADKSARQADLYERIRSAFTGGGDGAREE